MNNKVLIPFTHKGFCNGFPVWIHQSQEYGIIVFPRLFPTLSVWYVKLWNLLFTKDFLWTTVKLEDKIFIEQPKEYL